jgi:hypothetical protein
MLGGFASPKSPVDRAYLERYAMSANGDVHITPGMQDYIDKNNAYLAERGSTPSPCTGCTPWRTRSRTIRDRSSSRSS